MGIKRRTIELGSQDLGIADLAGFREKVVSGSWPGKDASELIVLSGFSGTFQFESLNDLYAKVKTLPTEPVYLYYSITYPSKARCSLYLDSDLPARIVLEGDEEWLSGAEQGIKALFRSGDRRYLLHNSKGFLIIWASVIGIAAMMIAGFVIGSGSNDPMIIIPVIISAGLLGIYLSLAKIKDIQPANTISLYRKREWWVESILHLLTVALGIISAIIASLIVSRLLN
jgi:hypothetical protein